MSYCTSCGANIPDGQGSSCSMCYGDPDHGSDGYCRQWLEDSMIEEEKEIEEQSSYEDNNY